MGKASPWIPWTAGNRKLEKQYTNDQQDREQNTRDRTRTRSFQLSGDDRFLSPLPSFPPAQSESLRRFEYRPRVVRLGTLPVRNWLNCAILWWAIMQHSPAGFKKSAGAGSMAICRFREIRHAENRGLRSDLLWLFI